MLSFTSFHCRGSSDHSQYFLRSKLTSIGPRKVLQTMERVLQNQGRGRVAEHWRPHIAQPL